MRESPIEDLFCRLWADAGGRAYKWVSPGNDGVPDRIAFLHGMVFLVELKATNGKLSKIQQAQHRELRMHGFDVVVLSSVDQVREWVEIQLQVLASRITRSSIEFVDFGETDEIRGLTPYIGFDLY